MSNPATDVVHSELDCSGHVIQELLGLTQSATDTPANTDSDRPPLRLIDNRPRYIVWLSSLLVNLISDWCR